MESEVTPEEIWDEVWEDVFGDMPPVEEVLDMILSPEPLPEFSEETANSLPQTTSQEPPQTNAQEEEEARGCPKDDKQKRCPHGNKKKAYCRKCKKEGIGGSQICDAHYRVASACVQCREAKGLPPKPKRIPSMCACGRPKQTCPDCKRMKIKGCGNALCDDHFKLLSSCVECAKRGVDSRAGTVLCNDHFKPWSSCVECAKKGVDPRAGTSLCPVHWTQLLPGKKCRACEIEKGDPYAYTQHTITRN